jgi:hypothetical protein
MLRKKALCPDDATHLQDEAETFQNNTIDQTVIKSEY